MPFLQFHNYFLPVWAIVPQKNTENRIKAVNVFCSIVLTKSVMSDEPLYPGGFESV